ncbi:hypothetical protein BGZ98_002619, partial [Dissophora globulifera]
MSDFQRGLQAFERLVKSDEGVRAGSCRKCGGSGHLTFECRNLIKLDGPAQKPKSNSRFGFLKKQPGMGAPSSINLAAGSPSSAKQGTSAGSGSRTGPASEASLKGRIKRQ